MRIVTRLEFRVEFVVASYTIEYCLAYSTMGTETQYTFLGDPEEVETCPECSALYGEYPCGNVLEEYDLQLALCAIDLNLVLLAVFLMSQVVTSLKPGHSGQVGSASVH